jgi:uncharacterized protein (DUF488 family)
MTEEVKFEPVCPGDLEELLKGAFAAGAGWQTVSSLAGEDLVRWKEYRKSPAPRTTHQRVDHALKHLVVDGMPMDLLNAASSRIRKTHVGELSSETICVIEEELLDAYVRAREVV